MERVEKASGCDLEKVVNFPARPEGDHGLAEGGVDVGDILSDRDGGIHSGGRDCGENPCWMADIGRQEKKDDNGGADEACGADWR